MNRNTAEQSALVNTGVQTLNLAAAETMADRTLIVLGVARSGTTMVAGALHQLGVDMMAGQRPNPVYEDVELGEAMEARDARLLSRLIAARNARAPVWGWKRPSALAHIARLERQFRNPHYVVVFRDLLAIANRNRISVRADLLENLDETLAQYRALLGFVRRTQRPLLLVSYEKAMTDRDGFLDALVDYIGGCDAQARERAGDFIRINSPAYLLSARNWRIRGELSSIEADRVMGWAFAPGSKEPVVVRLLINGRLFGTQVAELPRPLLKERRMHATGHCGFNFRLPKNKQLGPGDEVSVRVVGEVEDLRFSPRRYVEAEPGGG